MPFRPQENGQLPKICRASRDAGRDADPRGPIGAQSEEHKLRATGATRIGRTSQQRTAGQRADGCQPKPQSAAAAGIRGPTPPIEEQPRSVFPRLALRLTLDPP